MKKELKICFFSGDISRTGGTERVTTLIANELIERGYDVSILSFVGGKHSGFLLNKKIKLFTLLNKEFNNMQKISKQILPILKLKEFINREKINVIIDVDVFLSLYTIPLKLFTNIKIVSWEHFNLKSNNGVKKRDIARRMASKFSDKLIVLTDADKMAYINKFPKIENIIRIYNPSSYPICYEELKREKLLISVGRLTEQKNFEILIEAWKKVEEIQPEWKLNIIGSGEEREKLLEQIKEYKLRNVEIIPFTNKISEYYKKASGYVLSSKFEGFPMVLLEAQSYGIPIVAFDCETGPREIVRDNIDGLLVEANNVEMLSNKILELINNDENRDYYSKEAKVNAEKFSVKKITDEWEKIINDLY